MFLWACFASPEVAKQTPGPSSVNSGLGTRKPDEEGDNVSPSSFLPTASPQPHPRDGHTLHLEGCRSSGSCNHPFLLSKGNMSQGA